MEYSRSRDRERGRSRDSSRDEGDKCRSRGNDRSHDKDKWRERERDGEQKRARERSSKNPTRDHHRRHLEKLMEHPEKPVSIPEASKDRKPRDPPDFVRFYMGSSAGAGSEVFHVYRHLRRRENERQDYISTKAHEEELEEEFQQTLALHRAEDNTKTAKKRAKRLKRKQRQKLEKKKGKGEAVSGSSVPSEKMEENNSEPEIEEEAHFIIGGK